VYEPAHGARSAMAMELTAISSIKSELGDDNPGRGGVELPVPRRSVVALLREREGAAPRPGLANRTGDRSTARAGIIPPPAPGKSSGAHGRRRTTIHWCGRAARGAGWGRRLLGRPRPASQMLQRKERRSLRKAATPSRGGARCHPGPKGCELTARDRSWIIPR
jgi:hypothetical protein